MFNLILANTMMCIGIITLIVHSSAFGIAALILWIFSSALSVLLQDGSIDMSFTMIRAIEIIAFSLTVIGLVFLI